MHSFVRPDHFFSEPLDLVTAERGTFVEAEMSHTWVIGFSYFHRLIDHKTTTQILNVGGVTQNLELDNVSRSI